MTIHRLRVRQHSWCVTHVAPSIAHFTWWRGAIHTCARDRYPNWTSRVPRGTVLGVLPCPQHALNLDTRGAPTCTHGIFSLAQQPNVVSTIDPWYHPFLAKRSLGRWKPLIWHAISCIHAPRRHVHPQRLKGNRATPWRQVRQGGRHSRVAVLSIVSHGRKRRYMLTCSS